MKKIYVRALVGVWIKRTVICWNLAHCPRCNLTWWSMVQQ